MPATVRTAATPALKWAGGKRWQVPHLTAIWDPHSRKRLVEPFCGGLSVSLGLMPDRALLNDVNPHLINFYEWIKKGLSVQVETSNEEAAYYRLRARFNELLRSGGAESREAASIFYYLNRTGYNGLCRFNGSGEFNVPFGRYKSITYAQSFPDLRSAFADWDFTSRDFEALRIRPTDFIYADPPYDVEFTLYAQGGFDWNDQERLARWLGKHKGPVVLANQATERVIELYRRTGFNLRFLDAPRRISCTGDRTPAREVLATKNL